MKNSTSVLSESPHIFSNVTDTLEKEEKRISDSKGFDFGRAVWRTAKGEGNLFIFLEAAAVKGKVGKKKKIDHLSASKDLVLSNDLRFA